MTLTVRRAQLADKPRILEIAAQIWDGEDYVPHVMDDWLTAAASAVAVAELDDVICGFGRISWPLMGYAWIEGLRTDPAFAHRGAGKAVLRYLIDAARGGGADVAGLATHVTNQTSIHMFEAQGFALRAGFVYLEARQVAPVRQAAAQSDLPVPVTADEALSFIRASAFLRVGQGYVPHGWHFYPVALGSAEVMAELPSRLGIRRDGELVALLCAGRPNRGEGEYTVDFLDGAAHAVETLLRHALFLARDRRTVEIMLPSLHGETVPALAVCRSLGFEPWSDYQADVFIYELGLPS